MGEIRADLASIISEVNGALGKGTIMRLDTVDAVDVEAIPTGSNSLDIAIGVGGLPRGRVVEIYGPESSGKTTLTLAVMAMAQLMKADSYAAIIDAEHAMDSEYAQKVGIDISRTIICQPDCGEQAWTVVEKLVQSSRPPEVIVVDSVAALVPKSEIDFDMNGEKSAQPGRQAAMMSLGLRKLTAMIAKSGTTVIFINQLREKIGVMFGNPETTPGGKALKFYASVRIDIRRIETILDSQKVAIGNRVKAKCVKNKVAPPFRQGEFVILFGQGIDKTLDLYETGVNLGLISGKVSGVGPGSFGNITWATLKEFRGMCEEDPMFKDSLYQAVRATAFPPKVAA